MQGYKAKPAEEQSLHPTFVRGALNNMRLTSGTHGRDKVRLASVNRGCWTCRCSDWKSLPYSHQVLPQGDLTRGALLLRICSTPAIKACTTSICLVLYERRRSSQRLTFTLQSALSPPGLELSKFVPDQPNTKWLPTIESSPERLLHSCHWQPRVMTGPTRRKLTVPCWHRSGEEIILPLK